MVSLNVVFNFISLNITDGFNQFDYGRACINMQHYNSPRPPTYNLKSIQVPITLIYGKNDIMADVKVSAFVILCFLTKATCYRMY